MKRRLAVVAFVAAITAPISATPASAGHGCGATNMSHAGPSGGMANAMAHVAANEANGNAGMFGAVANRPVGTAGC